MRIIADTATLYSPAEGKEAGIESIPVCVAINGKTYKDYQEISSAEYLKLIEEGGIPTSSQPAIGDIIDALENREEEILLLTVGDGLSGAYQNAMGVKNTIENNEYIHILNSKTLAGPLRYMAQKAVRLKEEGMDMEEIKAELQQCIESSMSFVIPADFDFLKRSGRLTPIAAKIGGLMKIVPVLTQTEDKTRITPFAIKRSWKKAVESIINHLKSSSVDENYLISVSHAGTYEKAVEVMEQIKAQLEQVPMEILHLSPALITHGGPGCIVIQAVKR